MIIDSHQHFWKYDAKRYDWITEEMSVLRRDYLPEDLEPILKQHDVDGTVLVQTDQDQAENEFMLKLAARNPFIRGVIGWVDLCSPEIHDHLEALSSYDLLKGFRHILQSEPDGFMLGEDFLRGIEALNEFGFTYDILIYADQLPSALKMVDGFPDQKFVIDHIAKPFIQTRPIETWASGIKELSSGPGIYCKVSGMITEADHNNWREEDIYPYLDVIFEAFDIERLMFGSDWPVCNLAGDYSQVIGLVDHYTSQLEEAGRAGFYGENATRFYNLKDQMV